MICKILSNQVSSKRVNSEIYLMILHSPEIASKAKPGQFVTIRCGNLLLRRPFSIAAVSTKTGEIHIFYKVVGTGTEWLSDRRKQEGIDITGPLGNGFTIDSETEIPILVGGGVGAAPLFSLYLDLLLGSTPAIAPIPRLLIGAKNRASLLPLHVLPIVGCQVATENGSYGYKGLVTELLEKNLQGKDIQLRRKAIYAAGPRSMLKEVARIAKEHQIPCQVSLEERMACGMGECRGCVIQTTKGNKSVCFDGPVFDAQEVIWNET